MSAESPSRPNPPNGRRSNSLVGEFIKRTRSADLLGDRRSSSNLMRDKLHEGEQQEQLASNGRLQNTPPRLPSVQQVPQLQTFGGENYAPKMEAAPPSATVTAQVTAHTRTESMTNRGRYSYATSTINSVNSPRRVRRRKDPTPYNILVIGARNSGKSSFINFLRSSIAPYPDQQNIRNPELDLPPPSVKTNPGTFVQSYQEIEIEHERIGLSIWDSQGFDKNLVDFQLRELSNFVESKFEDTFIEEMKVVRSPGYRDTHIHCVFFLFDPTQLDININAARKGPSETIGSLRKPTRIVGALDEDFELQILKNLQGKTTVIPVISKADTVTMSHMAYLKRMVGESFQQAGLDPLEALHFEGYDSEDDALDKVDEEEANFGQDEKRVQPEVSETETAEGEIEDSTESTPVLPTVDDSEDTASLEPQANTKKALTHKREPSQLSVSTVMFDNGYMPMSVLSPDEHSLYGAEGPVGRRFVWGFADPYNSEHCDFVKLKETCFIEWRAEFREASREVFYERWRTGRLNRATSGGTSNGLQKTAAPVPMSRKVSSGIPIELTARPKYT